MSSAFLFLLPPGHTRFVDAILQELHITLLAQHEAKRTPLFKTKSTHLKFTNIKIFFLLFCLLFNFYIVIILIEALLPLLKSPINNPFKHLEDKTIENAYIQRLPFFYFSFPTAVYSEENWVTEYGGAQTMDTCAGQ